MGAFGAPRCGFTAKRLGRKLTPEARPQIGRVSAEIDYRGLEDAHFWARGEYLHRRHQSAHRTWRLYRRRWFRSAWFVPPSRSCRLTSTSRSRSRRNIPCALRNCFRVRLCSLLGSVHETVCGSRRDFVCMAMTWTRTRAPWKQDSRG